MEVAGCGVAGAQTDGYVATSSEGERVALRSTLRRAHERSQALMTPTGPAAEPTWGNLKNLDTSCHIKLREQAFIDVSDFSRVPSAVAAPCGEIGITSSACPSLRPVRSPGGW